MKVIDKPIFRFDSLDAAADLFYQVLIRRIANLTEIPRLGSPTADSLGSEQE